VTDTPFPIKGWQKSSFSGADGCTELGEASDGQITMRNSKDLDAGVIFFSRAQIGDLILRVCAGELDHLRL
jgi:uncharacterized protein DUF397